jgi:hypothetical protein
LAPVGLPLFVEVLDGRLIRLGQEDVELEEEGQQDSHDAG